MNTSKLTQYQVITAIVTCWVLCGCATTPEKQLTPEMSLHAAMKEIGEISQTNLADEPQGDIVVIKDRHSTRPGYHRVRPQLRQVQKDNRLLIEYLVRKGFDVLGCEQTFGEIVPNEETASQYKLISGRMKQGIDLDEHSVFQPIRFQILWGEKLAVWGVEDPDLFEQDIEDFVAFAQARQNVKRNDLSPSTRAEMKIALFKAYQRLGKNIQDRGQAAAENLIKIMAERQSKKAIFLLGGAHAPAAVRVFKKAQFNVHVFQSSRYETEKKPSSSTKK